MIKLKADEIIINKLLCSAELSTHSIKQMLTPIQASDVIDRCLHLLPYHVIAANRGVTGMSVSSRVCVGCWKIIRNLSKSGE
jgi:hypothetical protein